MASFLCLLCALLSHDAASTRLFNIHARRNASKRSAKVLGSSQLDDPFQEALREEKAKLQLLHPVDLQNSQGSSLSLIVYNVEWQVTQGKFLKKVPQALRNVVKYLSVDENPDFVVIVEATKHLMETLCPQTARHSEFADIDGSVFGSYAEAPCSYIFDQAGPEGIAILYKPQRFKLKRRSCIRGKAITGSVDRDEIHKGESALQNCIDLPEGVEFSHLEFSPPDYRTVLLAQFEEARLSASSGVTKSLVIAAVHPGHKAHNQDLLRLDKALRMFYKGLTSVPSMLIMTGDFNSGAGGIHVPWQKAFDEQVEKSKDPKYLEKKGVTPIEYMRQKTWQLGVDGLDVDDPFLNNSIKHVLGPFLRDNAYEFFKDAAGEGNAAEGEFAARVDQRTCCCKIWDKKKKEAIDACPKRGEPLKFAFDHILFAEAKDQPVKRYAVTVGQPGFPSSDHLPLKLVLEWNPVNPFHEFAVKAAYKGILGREVDPGGFATYVALLQQGGAVTKLTSELYDSQEYASSRASRSLELLASDLYLGILQRNGDENGLIATISALQERKGSLRAADMILSTEAKAIWSSQQMA